MKRFVVVVCWLAVGLALLAGLDNLFFQPQVPGLFIAGADITSALFAALVLLDRIHHVFDVLK